MGEKASELWKVGSESCGGEDEPALDARDLRFERSKDMARGVAGDSWAGATAAGPEVGVRSSPRSLDPRAMARTYGWKEILDECDEPKGGHRATKLLKV